MPTVKEQQKTNTRSNGSGLWAGALRRWHWLWTDTEHSESGVVFAPADVRQEADSTKEETAGSVLNLSPLKIIAWLGASAGGLTILLGAIGFLALSAHDVMLGIPRSIQNNPEYVTVGGLFFGRSIIFLVASFISVKSWIALAVLLIGFVVLSRTSKHQSRGRSLVIILFSLVLLGAEIYGLARLIRPLQISNLLLNFSSEGRGPAQQVIDALLVRDTTWLSVEYGFMVLLVVVFSTAFIFMEQAGRSRFWRVIRVPAIILLLICIFLLPRAYGVLTISNEYPTVVLESSNQSGSSPTNETRLLLREDKEAFVLYDPSSQSIVTLKRDSIAQHKMYAPQHVFTASVGKK